MVYMDEWEYNLWLELHREELLASKGAGSEDGNGQEPEVSGNQECE